MSISSATDSVRYLGDNSTAVYSYTFRIDSQSDLKAIKVTDTGVKSVLTLTTDYTVTGVGSGGGGTITLVAGNLPADYKLILRRQIPLTQDTEIRNEGTFYASQHENKFDELTMIDQQQQFEITRSMRLSEEVDADDFDMTIPGDIVGVSGKVPLTNDAGDGWAPVAEWPSSADIAGAQGAAAAAAVSEGLAEGWATNSAASAAAAAAAVSGVLTNPMTTGGDTIGLSCLLINLY